MAQDIEEAATGVDVAGRGEPARVEELAKLLKGQGTTLAKKTVAGVVNVGRWLWLSDPEMRAVMVGLQQHPEATAAFIQRGHERLWATRKQRGPGRRERPDCVPEPEPEPEEPEPEPTAWTDQERDFLRQHLGHWANVVEQCHRVGETVVGPPDATRKIAARLFEQGHPWVNIFSEIGIRRVEESPAQD